MANYDIDEMKKFMIKHKEDIEKNNFDDLYRGTFSTPPPPYITEFLLEAGIDPLVYMTYIPTGYAEDNENIQSLTLPQKIKFIGGWAFNGCDNLVKVDLNEGLEIIGSYAFKLCPITEIKLPSTVKVLSNGVFANCTKLSKIDLSNIEDISSSVFYDTSIETLYLPKTITLLRQGCFQGMSKLKEIIYEGTQEEWNNLIPIGTYWYYFLCGRTTLKTPDLKILG